MASPSKEHNFLKLILENSPLKQWHFEEIVSQAKVTKAVANKWLKKYVKEGLIKHTKPRGTFPYFVVGEKNSYYYSLKRVYMLRQLHDCGLISKLLSLDKTQTVILFGSAIRGDWYKDSDLDIFILGNFRNFDKQIYELKLQRSIELHIFNTKEELKEVKTGLVRNIVNGYVLKGQIQDIVKVA